MCPKSNLASQLAYLTKHIEEERGHDLWGESDLLYAKNDLAVDYLFDVKMPSNIHNVIHSLYQENKTFEFLGYILALEGFPGSVEYWKNFADKNSLSIKAFSSPIKHANLDKEHSRELVEHLYRYSSTPNTFEQILNQAIVTLTAISNAFYCFENQFTELTSLCPLKKEMFVDDLEMSPCEARK